MPSNSMSDIPNNAGPSLGTTKHPHLAALSLCLIFTEHMPSCSIFELLYVSSTIIIVLHSKLCLYCWLWKYCFKYVEWHKITICSGINLYASPSLTGTRFKLCKYYTFYASPSLTGTRLKPFKYYIFYAIKVEVTYPYHIKALSMFVLFHQLWLITLFDLMDPPATFQWYLVHPQPLCQSAHNPEVIRLSTFSTFLPVSWSLSQKVPCPAVFVIFYSLLLAVLLQLPVVFIFCCLCLQPVHPFLGRHIIFSAYCSGLEWRHNSTVHRFEFTA